MPTQAQRSQATQSKLLRTARRLFSDHGYAATSVDQIVTQARLTKGAFYHHFSDKEAVFVAVLEEAAQKLVATALAGVQGSTALERFRSGCRAYLEACLDSGVQRIVLQDGPAVLGWQRWREIDWRHGLGVLENGLQAAMAEGALTQRSTKTLAHLLFGALCESALVISRSPQPATTIAEVAGELDALLLALLGPSPRQKTQRQARR